MDLNEYKVFADSCFRDTPPPCGAVCPFSYNVREFIRQMQKGSYRSAIRILRNSMVFPGIVANVCPGYCMDSCVRGKKEGDRSVDLKLLEQRCVEHTAKQKPNRYTIPRKPQKIAVIGGGLSGLACAYRMASYGYTVTVYEMTENLGGSVLLELAPSICQAEFEKAFGTVDCEFVMEAKVTDLAEIQADAIYIATGKGGEDFGLYDGTSYGLACGMSPGVFLGGRLTGADLMESLAQGLEAAAAIETFLKIGKMDPIPSPKKRLPDTRYYGLHYDFEGQDNTEVKGDAEAGRCLSCNCRECYDVCPMMEKERRFPRQICGDVVVTLKPNMCQRTGVRIINGCTFCGKCKEACPEQIDMAECLQQARNGFYESGAMAQAFHDFWLQDMEFSRSEEAGLIWRPSEETGTEVVYFPGCQLGASQKELVLLSYEEIRRHSSNSAIWLGCCGIPARWAGRQAEAERIAAEIQTEWEKLGKPLVVTACPSCLANLEMMNPGMNVQSIYEYLAADGGVRKKTVNNGQSDDSEKLVRILDPCAAAGHDEMAAAVRQLLKEAGYFLEAGNEIPDPACCGFGGHIYQAVPSLYDTFAKRRIDGETGICGVYCANCREAFVYGGADARHVLELLLGETGRRDTLPELDERRENRRALKRYFTGQPEPEKEAAMQIEIPMQLIDKMNRELILREQVQAVIEEAEKTGRKVYDPEQNIYYGHGSFGCVTVWAGYQITEADILVTSVYCHRVQVEESL